MISVSRPITYTSRTFPLRAQLCALTPIFSDIALHLVGRTSEALEAVEEAEALIEMTEERWCSAELLRLRGVFLAALSAEEAQIEASFRASIRIAKEQKSDSLATRAEASYAEYRRQKGHHKSS